MEPHRALIISRRVALEPASGALFSDIFPLFSNLAPVILNLAALERARAQLIPARAAKKFRPKALEIRSGALEIRSGTVEIARALLKFLPQPQMKLLQLEEILPRVLKIALRGVELARAPVKIAWKANFDRYV